MAEIGNYIIQEGKDLCFYIWDKTNRQHLLDDLDTPVYFQSKEDATQYIIANYPEHDERIIEME